MAMSIYNSTRDLKITYLLGAGASYHSLPIWKAQAKSMVDLAGQVIGFANQTVTQDVPKYPKLFDNKKLISFFDKLKRFGQLGQEYGSIDVYARRLFLLGDSEELNALKYCVSVYFDIWENFLYQDKMITENTPYQKIDKRYYSVLSVILENMNGKIALNENVSFLSWNYDLQLEMSFDSFLKKPSESLDELNTYFNFMGQESDRNNIIHLNGHRGVFYCNGKCFENVEKFRCADLDEYLERLLDNFEDFKYQDYNTSIKYAWEAEQSYIDRIKNVMSTTNILIIIGYSFPAFNRKIDKELISFFESSSQYKKVVYQDPFANIDIVNSLFNNPSIVEIHRENTAQFYIPHEFLSPHDSMDFFC